MQVTTLLSLAAVVTTAIAGVVDTHPWKAPTKNDRRGPCPMLNSLANHGFIARSGKDISIDQLVNAIEEAINISPNSTRPVVEFGATTSTTGNPNTFHLSDLNKHGVIEHDGSLSRNDLYFGDNHSFNSRIYDTVAKFFTKSTISIETAARARKARLAAAAAANPQFQYGEQEETVSLFETALYLATFGTGTQGNAPTKYVNILFREERLPYKEGYCKPTRVISNDDIVELADKVRAAA
ncbi:unnamed protein product [Parascedosporium putredinis]|uniref:Heme haloperoxidase family profile domain-containing protein n=1 Tax=Parascedosporium putredinis TaxID=1442378 RepID=A0A9P1H0M2_9PEZI|nr:unnamed protein product [Parascedosporium putredinis]CAI7994069.1 unnamed protein product [Parascedosporium putredinis]